MLIGRFWVTNPGAENEKFIDFVDKFLRGSRSFGILGGNESISIGQKDGMTSKAIAKDLKLFVQPGKASAVAKYLQAVPGGYGEGDKFLGVAVPDIRRVAKQHFGMSAGDLSDALRSPWHEVRLCALFVLVRQFDRVDEDEQSIWFRFYLDHLDFVNNWDLVDSSARHIVGEYVLVHRSERKVLYDLADSGQLWRERVSVVATQALLKRGEFEDLIRLAKRFLTHPHDLIHKAVGWMLREMGDEDLPALIQFLEKHSKSMPRTMLRYSIEKFPEADRKYFMQR